MTSEGARWMRLCCRDCGAHAVVMSESVREAVCPVCGGNEFDEVAAEREAPERRHRA